MACNGHLSDTYRMCNGRVRGRGGVWLYLSSFKRGFRQRVYLLLPVPTPQLSVWRSPTHRQGPSWGIPRPTQHPPLLVRLQSHTSKALNLPLFVRPESQTQSDLPPLVRLGSQTGSAPHLTPNVRLRCQKCSALDLTRADFVAESTKVRRSNPRHQGQDANPRKSSLGKV